MGARVETAAEDIPPTYLSGADWVFVKGSVVTRYKLRKDKIKKIRLQNIAIATY